jgi:RAT1-interacting protein
MQKPYRQPTTGAHLANGLHHFIQKLDDAADLTHPITALHHAQFDLAKEQVHFITYRNNLNKIMAAPYQREPWDIAVHKNQGLIHLDVVKSNDNSFNNSLSEDQQKLFTFYGYRFEAYCTYPSHVSDCWNSEESEEEINTNEEFCSVFLSKFGDHRVVIAAEIDCMDFKTHQYVEIKTSKFPQNERQQSNFERYKLLKFWIQSYLVNVPTLVVGFRDDAGIVQRVEEIQTHELPKRCRHLWSSDKCISLTHQVLSVLRSNVEENHKYILSYGPPFKEISLRRLEEN